MYPLPPLLRDHIPCGDPRIERRQRGDPHPGSQ